MGTRALRRAAATTTAAAAVGALVLGSTCAGGLRPGKRPAATQPAGAPADVKVLSDLTYYTGPDADTEKHRLDLYLPRGKRGVAVVMFVHGGAWRSGDRRLYRRLGVSLAESGLAAAVISYRLSPAYKHPAHVTDVARAFAWLRANVGRYGGRPDRIFLMGHSAGGHLVALAALDRSYLAAQGESTAAISGVIPVSGVYRVVGRSPWGMMGKAFGTDGKVQEEASPINHVRGDAPPFRIIYASRDPVLLRRQARAFFEAMRKAGARAELVEVPRRNHISIIRRFSDEDDPARRAVLDFVRVTCGRMDRDEKRSRSRRPATRPADSERPRAQPGLARAYRSVRRES